MPVKSKIVDSHFVLRIDLNCINDSCVVCRRHINTTIEGSLTKISIGSCGHAFHEKCINTWISELDKKTCPICQNEFIKVNK